MYSRMEGHSTEAFFGCVWLTVSVKYDLLNMKMQKCRILGRMVFPACNIEISVTAGAVKVL
jgi:hypothetical protein